MPTNLLAQHPRQQLGELPGGLAAVAQGVLQIGRHLGDGPVKSGDR